MYTRGKTIRKSERKEKREEKKILFEPMLVDAPPIVIYLDSSRPNNYLQHPKNCLLLFLHTPPPPPKTCLAITSLDRSTHSKPEC